MKKVIAVLKEDETHWHYIDCELDGLETDYELIRTENNNIVLNEGCQVVVECCDKMSDYQIGKAIIKSMLNLH